MVLSLCKRGLPHTYRTIVVTWLWDDQERLYVVLHEDGIFLGLWCPFLEDVLPIEQLQSLHRHVHFTANDKNK